MESAEFKEKSAIEKLLLIMSMLRDQNFGCPWDLEQNISSLASHTQEEVYEVIDAIEKNDMESLVDELGDLLFQIVFYAQIANERKVFDFNDVANSINNKLIRRHPHVFPEGKVENFGVKGSITSKEVAFNWELIKKREKRDKAEKESLRIEESLLDDVPLASPALERSKKLQKRAATAGFDWLNLPPVIAKLKEEIAELEGAVSDDSHEQITAEVGDVLFSAVNVSRHLKVDPEMALRSSNARFEKRFRWIENKLRGQDKLIEEVKLSELNKLWDQAKLSGL
jgi:ATP diphosphatase